MRHNITYICTRLYICHVTRSLLQFPNNNETSALFLHRHHTQEVVRSEWLPFVPPPQPLHWVNHHHRHHHLYHHHHHHASLLSPALLVLLEPLGGAHGRLGGTGHSRDVVDDNIPKYVVYVGSGRLWYHTGHPGMPLAHSILYIYGCLLYHFFATTRL